MTTPMVTLEFEFKTSTKVYNYLRRYINAGIKFRNCLCYEFNQTKEIKKIQDITDKYNFKLKQYDLFDGTRNNLFPMGKVKWNKGTKRAYYKYKKEGKEWNDEVAKEYTNLKYKKRYQVNCFTLSHRRIRQEGNIITFLPAVNYALGVKRTNLNNVPEELKIKLVGYEERVRQYKGFVPKYYKIKKSLDKMFILITGEYEEFILSKRYEREEVIGIDTGLDKEATHILSNGEKYTTITKNIERNEKKLNNMKSRYDKMYDRKSNTKCLHQLYLEHEIRNLELRLQRQRKARAIYIAYKVNRKAKVVIMDDVKASDLFKLSKKNWNKCRGPKMHISDLLKHGLNG
jgi:hypothetical protein